MERSEDWARLEAALRVIGELQAPDNEADETTPEQVAALLVDEHGKPTMSDERQEQARFANATSNASPKGSGGDTFKDAFGNVLTSQQVAGMRDSKGRPIVIPR